MKLKVITGEKIEKELFISRSRRPKSETYLFITNKRISLSQTLKTRGVSTVYQNDIDINRVISIESLFGKTFSKVRFIILTLLTIIFSIGSYFLIEYASIVIFILGITITFLFSFVDGLKLSINTNASSRTVSIGLSSSSSLYINVPKSKIMVDRDDFLTLAPTIYEIIYENKMK